MRKISHKNQAMLDTFAVFGITVEAIRKKYTLAFVVRLYNHLTNKHQIVDGKYPVIYPNYIGRDHFDEYIQMLKEAGFEIHTSTEPFMDEDTGKIVTLIRHSLSPLKKK